MMRCPFTGEDYEGDIVEYTCDSCGMPTAVEEDAYGQTVLVLCNVVNCHNDNGDDRYEPELLFSSVLTAPPPVHKDDVIQLEESYCDIW